MKKRQTTSSHMSVLDFSQDSRVRKSLLSQIKGTYYGALEDEALDYLNAAGALDESRLPEKHGLDEKK